MGLHVPEKNYGRFTFWGRHQNDGPTTVVPPYLQQKSPFQNYQVVVEGGGKWKCQEALPCFI